MSRVYFDKNETTPQTLWAKREFDRLTREHLDNQLANPQFGRRVMMTGPIEHMSFAEYFFLYCVFIFIVKATGNEPSDPWRD